jgi:hypothetical protein
MPRTIIAVLDVDWPSVLGWSWVAGAGPNLADASQPIPLTKFCRIFLLQYLVSKIGPFPPGTEGIFIKGFTNITAMI